MKRFLTIALLVVLTVPAALGEEPVDDRGFSPGRVYSFHGLDSVNQFNGNLNVRIPIGPSFRVSEKLSWQLVLSYNSHLWKYRVTPPASPADTIHIQAYPRASFNAGFGWHLSLGKLFERGDPDNEPVSGRWTFQSGDGANHEFYDQMHTGATGTADTMYSRDGTYLRMRVISETEREVQFPDGTVYVFAQLQPVEPPQAAYWPVSGESHEWFLKTMRDAYGNHVDISYETTAAHREVWHIFDNGRMITVRFRASTQLFFYNELDYVEMPAVEGTPIRYYCTIETIDVPPGFGDNLARTPANVIAVRVLTAVTPKKASDLTTIANGYSMMADGLPAYDGSTATPGVLTRLVLPTLGSIGWTYTVRDFAEGVPDRPRSPAIERPSAVRTRYTCDPASAATCNPLTAPTWEYDVFFSAAPICHPTCFKGDGTAYICNSGRSRQLTAWMTEPGAASEARTTITYFSAYQNVQDPNGDSCARPEGWVEGELGLPFTRYATDGENRFLSSEIRMGFDPDVTFGWDGIGAVPDPASLQKEKTYLRYKLDPDAADNGRRRHDFNARIESSATYYTADTGCGGICVRRSEFRADDGLGHFQQVSTNDNFPGDGNFRTTFAGYDSAPAASEPWILGTTSEQCVADETQVRTDEITSCASLTNAAVTRTSFNHTTGALNARRTLKGPGSAPGTVDLLSTFSYDAKGTLTEERFHGGDQAEQALDTDELHMFTPPQAGPRYVITHAPTYAHATYSGLTKLKSTYSNGVVAGDADYDAWTGLLTTNRDVAGLPTQYEYDLLGRLRFVRPPGETEMSYDYTDASQGASFSAARVLASKGSIATEYQYDGLGRVWREKAKQPVAGTVWSIVQTSYDGAGHTQSVSMAETLTGSETSFVPSHSTTYSNFDVSGNPVWTDLPDGKRIVVSRTGIRQIAKSAHVATSAAAETLVTTTEIYDARGRLFEVKENSGPTSAVSPSGAEVTTRYKYDASDRLRSVTMNSGASPQQLRTFTYDNRGFLTDEQLPELGVAGNGTVAYRDYDARGHAGRKITGTADGPFDLKFKYDDSERLILVTDADPLSTTSPRARRPVKSFKYAFSDSTTDEGIDHRQGRLLEATRVNHLPSLPDPVIVTETYEYTNGLGRTSARTTLVQNGPVALQNDAIVMSPGATKMQELKQGFTYNPLGELVGIQYPFCVTTASCSSVPSRTITRAFTNGALTSVDGFGTLTYNANGTVRTVTHGGGSVSDTYEPDPNNLMARPGTITFSGYCTGPPVNANQPENKTIVSGATATLSVSQEGSGSRTYTWYQVVNGVATAIPNSNAATFTTAPLSATSYFHVMVSDGTCSTRSRTATVTIRTCDSVDITTQPVSKVVTSGSPVTFTVVATDPSAHYEWYEGFSGTTTNRVGGDSSHYDVASATASTRYWVRVFSGDRLCSIDSATATLDICTPPVITVQPQSQSHAIPASGSATLSTSVVATGHNLRYEWYQVGAAPVPVGTGPTLSVTLTSADPGPKDYYVRVISDTSGCGNPAISQVITMRLNDCFTFFSSPGDHLAYPGADIWTLSVRAEGAGAPFTYKWFHGVNGQSIELGHTEDIVVGLTGDYDAFWCVVTCSNNSGCQGQSMTTPKSYASRWGVCPLPPVSVSPVTATIVQGTTATFTASVDWPRVTYQWYRGQSGDTRNPLGGETHKTLTVASVVSTGYWVRVTDECGTHSEDSRTVTVGAGSCIPITIDANPQSVNIAAGGGATLHAAASSSSSFSYAWFAEGSTTSLGNGASFTVHPAVTTTYYAAASNNCFTAETLPATVHVTSCGTINITQQPDSHPIPAGSTTGTDLSITATSTGGAILYQWYRGTSGDTSHPIDLATSSIVHVTPAETTSYWVRLTTASCTIDSATAVVTWCVPPHFQTAVYGASLRLGQWALLESTAVGTDLQYEWSIEGAPETVISRERAFWIQPSNTTRYILKVIGCLETIYSPPVVIMVCTTPAVVTQPQHKAVFPGKTAQLHVSAWEANDVPITYQWQDAATGSTVGTNSPDFTTPPITEEKRYLVHLQAGVCGTDSEEVTVSLCTLPEVVTAGATLNVTPQQTVTLHLPFTATSDNSYAWYHGPVGNTSDPVGGNSYDYSFFAAASGEYWATVTNPDGCVSRSGAFIVNVCVPSITQQPVSIMLSPPATSVPLSVTASPATAYQWYIGEKGDITTPVSGGTTATINVSPATDTRYWVRVIGSCGLDERGAPIGTTDSESALVTRCQPPAITQTTPGPWIVRGSSFGIGVVASGTSLTYQWYTGTSGNTTSPINGATGANYTAAPQNTTSYWVRVTGTCGSLNSSTITVSVCMTPSITAQPQSVSIFSGSTTTLSVTAFEGTTAPVSYQWYRGASGDTFVPVGTNAATYTTPALTANTDYWVRVSCGTCAPADSQTATVSMCPYAQTIAAPPNAQAAIGQVTRLTGTSAVAGNSYRWYRGVSGDQSTPLTNWQSVNYLDVNPTVTTQYWYQLQNGACTSNSGTVTVNVCVPTITTQPASVMINPGASTTLSVAANTPGLTYQWFTGTSGTTTTPINGATGASVSVSPSTATNYWVRVTGSCGVATNSVTAAVTICQPPAITQTTPGPWIVRGSSFGIGVVASGTSLTYQWYTGTSGNTSSPINGATGSNYTAAPQNTTSYWVRVTGTCGSLNSATITVSVCMTPSITAQPQSVSIFSGSTTTLSVTAFEGTTAPINYQWYRGAAGDTSVPVGTNAATFTTPALTANTNYWVRVSCGTCAPADSQTATVSICANPQIVSSSGDVQTAVGQLTRLTIYASGDSWSWYRGAAGDTTNPISIGYPYTWTDVNPSVTTQYWGQVNNGTCVSRTNTITVSVCVPQITQQPQSVTIASGATTTLTAAANTAGVTYRWYIGTSGNTTSPITGATNPTLTVTPTATTSYWMRATSSCGRTVDSNTATVTLCSPPVITRQPLNVSSYVTGNNVPVDVLATGSGLAYQWYIGESGDTSTPVGNRDNASGGTTSVLTYSPFTTTTRVWVRITGQCGSVNSNAAWASIIPTIGGQPQGQVVSSGSSATVTVYANANGSALHYQWKNAANGAVIPGSGDSYRLVLPSVTAPINVYCAVTSGAATVNSYAAEVTLCSGPTVTTGWVPNGSCRFISAQINGEYSQIEWYRGQPGDTSQYWGASTAFNFCPTAPTTFWARVYGIEGCNADSPSVTVSP